MEKFDKLALQTAKEIVVKFIEVGRVSPTNFSEIFPAIYGDILAAIERGGPAPQSRGDSAKNAPGA